MVFLLFMTDSSASAWITTARSTVTFETNFFQIEYSSLSLGETSNSIGTFDDEVA